MSEHFKCSAARRSLRMARRLCARAILSLHVLFPGHVRPRANAVHARAVHAWVPFDHSPSYSLPPMPTRSLRRWKETKYEKNLDPKSIGTTRRAAVPRRHRKGILTHPAWLIAHSSNFHTDPIRRGRWIREKLLAGRVPDVPITVDAQVPDDPHKTLRERVEGVTHKNECWKCHQHMNPLGLCRSRASTTSDAIAPRRVCEHPENLIRTAGTGRDAADVYKTSPIDSQRQLERHGRSATRRRRERCVRVDRPTGALRASAAVDHSPCLSLLHGPQRNAVRFADA